MAFTLPDKGEGDNDILVAIYALCDPITGTVRYIGKTINPDKRLRAHLTDSRLKNRTHKTHWINSLPAPPVLNILEWCGSHEEASKQETRWIAEMRLTGLLLTNATDGGEGQPGLRHTEETRAKISVANNGRPVSEETRAKIRAFNVGKRYALGKKHSPEARERHRLAALGRGPFRGQKHLPETIEKMREARRAYWQARKVGA